MRRKNVLSVIALVVVSSTALGACARKSFVRTSVGQVNDKVDALGRSLEETQERTRQNETQIAAVDQRVGTVSEAAAAAQTTADRAAASASSASTAAATANATSERVEKAEKRLVYELVLSENQGNFRFGSRDLPDDAKAKLDQLIGQLKADPRGAFFEIEGHTDNVGDAVVNERLGLQRAEAVKRFLYEQYQIPLHKMNTISYGETKPAASNATSAGRAQNRRVVIRVIV